MFPMRLTKSWNDLKASLDEAARVLEWETDYEREAETLTRARKLFHEDDGVVVPRLYEKYSTPRILTMEYIDGVHIEPFLSKNPSQDVRDEFGRKIHLAVVRLDGAR